MKLGSVTSTAESCFGLRPLGVTFAVFDGECFVAFLLGTVFVTPAVLEDVVPRADGLLRVAFFRDPDAAVAAGRVGAMLRLSKW